MTDCQEAYIMTSQGTLSLSQVVDCVVQGILSLQRHSRLSKLIHSKCCRAADMKMPNRHKSLSFESFVEEIFEPCDAPSGKPSFLLPAGLHTQIFTRVLSEIVISFNHNTDAETRKIYVLILKDLLILVSARVNEETKDAILSSAAQDLVYNLPLVIGVLTSLYFEISALHPLMQKEAVNINHLDFWNVQIGEKWAEEKNRQSLLIVYDSLLSLCISNYLHREAFRRSSACLLELLTSCPFITTSSWKILTEAIQSDGGMQKEQLQSLLQSLVLLQIHKPAVKECVLSILLYCSCMINSSMICTVAAETIYSSLPLRELYRVVNSKNLIVYLPLREILGMAVESLIQGIDSLCQKVLKSLGDAEIDTKHKHITALLDSRFSFAFYSRIHAAISFAAVLKPSSNLSDEARSHMNNSLKINEHFHVAIIRQCTDVQFHSFLMEHYRSSEELVSYIMSFISDYLLCLRVPYIKCGTELLDRSSTERVFVHTVCRSLHQASRNMKLLSMVVRFLTRKEFTNFALPEILRSSHSQQHMIQSIFLKLLSQTDNNSSGLTAGEVFLQLSLEPVFEENLANISQCIEILINLRQPSVENGRYILDNDSIVGSFKKLLEIRPWPVIMMRSLIQCLNIHPELVHWSLTKFLPEVIREEPWKSDPSIWKGMVKIIVKYDHESIHLIVQLPKEIASSLFESHPNMKNMVSQLLSKKTQSKEGFENLKDLLQL